MNNLSSTPAQQLKCTKCGGEILVGAGADKNLCAKCGGQPEVKPVLTEKPPVAEEIHGITIFKAPTVLASLNLKPKSKFITKLEERLRKI